ncbi:MAG TPA: hypothetical protein VHV49_17880 [Pseudonocardiaceae bacterium]|nr:hypothetical protein [Pseudonocardiaceae bacterium]
MGASSYDAADISQSRQTIAGEAGKFGSVGDAVPTSVAAAMFGTLPNSSALAQAAAALCTAVRREYSRAESLVGSIERALDQNLTRSGTTEQNNKRSFSTERV